MVVNHAPMNLGALYIGALVCCALYGLFLTQVGHYFNVSRNDRVLQKTAVAILLALETVYAFTAGAGVYHHTISLVNNPIIAGFPSEILSYSVLPNVLAFFVVNTFMSYQYYRLTKKLWLWICLQGLVFIDLSMYLWCLATLVLSVKGRPAPGAIAAPTVGLATQVAVTLLVTALLITYLRPFLRTEVLATKELLTRIIIVIVETGFLTATLALSNLIAFRLGVNNAIPFVLGGCLGRVASLSMMANLNMRGHGGHLVKSSTDTQASHSVQYPFTSTRSRTGTNVGTRSNIGNGIAIHQTMKIQIDDANRARHSFEGVGLELAASSSQSTIKKRDGDVSEASSSE